jgi:hypothetical protein
MTGHNEMARIKNGVALAPKAARALLVACASLAAACGLETPGERSSVVDSQSEALVDGNGLSRNGLSRNGLSRNGLSRNGLSRNGLDAADFVSWFNEDAASSNTLMKYVYACAAAPGTSVTWKNPKTGVIYSWTGALGLATSFAHGAAPTTAEQQMVSACLAAHVNPYGLSVPISVLGRSATGVEIPFTQSEISTYNVQEACWFGNFFSGEGVGLAFDTGSQGPQTSATRACSFNAPSRQDCAPVVVTGKYCWDICSRGGASNYWATCSWNGKSYPAVTTRYRHLEVATCGDLVCQVSEHCGTTLNANACSDCGPCP